MKCSRCQHENPSALKFCGECGTRLAAACAACGAANSPEQKFCGECGAKLSADTAKATGPSADSYTSEHLAENIPTSKSALEGERRQLTVMFCDMVGSTELSQKLDPETLRDLMRAYQKTCGQIIEKYDGHVAQYLGDGLMTYFGWPRAHEDDAERAIRAGLEIVEAVKHMQTPESLHVRIGIATGPVVVGETGAGDASVPKLAVGETPNVAARIQGLAEADQIIIGPDTRHLIGGTFDLDDAGEHTLKGIVEPVRAWRVTGLASSEGRFDAAHGEELTPLVGRELELGLLIERWQLAQDGEGQVVLLSGEPGIGKSRILSALREKLESIGAKSMRFQCSPYYVNSAFWPSIDNFERALKFARDEASESKLDKLESLIVGHYQRPLTDVRFIATMLSIPCDARYGELAMSPQKFKDETLRALVDLTEAAAKKQPSVMLFEDLHWSDPTTLEVLDLLVDRVKGIPLLIVLTHRPEFLNRWSDHGHVSAVNLSKLTRTQSSALVSRVAGSKVLPPDLLEQILVKTDGVPLFVEELTKSILESGELTDAGDHYEYAGSARRISIPATLRDSLMARLDRFMPVKEIAQIGAAIGREFSYELIAAVAPMTQTPLDVALSQLAESGLAFKRGTPPDATYTFKHALVQDAAYDSLLKSRRQELHGKIARVLEEDFPKTKDTEPELLAHHALRGQLWEKAARYSRQAGTRAIDRSALREALVHFDQARDVLQELPESQDRTEQLIDLCLEQRNVFLRLGEIERVGEVLNEARALAEGLDDQRRLGWALSYQAVFYTLRGKDALAVKAGERACGIAESLIDRGLRVAANYYLAQSLWYAGDPRRAAEALFATIPLIEGAPAGERFGLPVLPAVTTRHLLAKVLADLGKFAEALIKGEEGLRIAQIVGHPYSEVWARYGLGYAHVRHGDFAAAIGVLEPGLPLARTMEFRLILPIIAASLGSAYLWSGRTADAIRLLEEAVEAFIAMRTPGFESLCIVFLAEAYLVDGRITKAREQAEQAVALARGRQQFSWEAWALKLLGDVNAHTAVEVERSAAELAETAYRAALALATELGMRPLVAHCHFGLGKLYAKSDQREAATEPLATATTLYREMDMQFWLEQAEAEMTDLA